MIGISKEELLSKLQCIPIGISEFDHGRNSIPVELLNECKELNEWKPISEAKLDGRRYLLHNKKWDDSCTGGYDGCLWRMQFGIPAFVHQPTHFQELPEIPKEQ